MINRPIFLIGSGRSGTTVCYHLMAVHPQVCWFSNLTDRLPSIGCTPILHRLLDIPWISSRIGVDLFGNRTRGRLRPAEGQRIYHDLAGMENLRRSDAHDYSESAMRKLQKQIRNHLRWAGGERFLSKQTANNQRVELLDRIFPDANYIHVIRDGRAVVNSLLHVPWWETTVLWWAQTTAGELADQDSSLQEVAARHWQTEVVHLQQFGRERRERYLEIRYEDLVRDVHAQVAKLLRGTGLDSNEKILERLPPTLPDQNQKWQENLSPADQELLQTIIGEDLHRLGYIGTIDPVDEDTGKQEAG